MRNRTANSQFRPILSGDSLAFATRLALSRLHCGLITTTTARAVSGLDIWGSGGHQNSLVTAFESRSYPKTENCQSAKLFKQIVASIRYSHVQLHYRSLTVRVEKSPAEIPPVVVAWARSGRAASRSALAMYLERWMLDDTLSLRTGTLCPQAENTVWTTISSRSIGIVVGTRRS